MQQVDTLIGLQRGDEGKGRIADILSWGYDVVARYNGADNAGHSLVHEGSKLALHQVPSGIRNPNTLNLLGNGVLLNPVRLRDEFEDIENVLNIEITPARVAISSAAHLLLPHHIALDELREDGKGAQGTTIRGVSFVAGDKYRRDNIRAESMLEPEKLRAHASKNLTPELVDKLQAKRVRKGEEPYDPDAELDSLVQSAKQFVPYLTNTEDLMHRKLADGAKVLAEGAQAAGLDIELAPYPMATSSHTGVAGALLGLGIGPKQIGEVIGVVKAVKSHVGGGPFITEIKDKEIADRVRGSRDAIDGEYGATTGRARRIGYLDLAELRRATRVNDVTQLVLNKVDCLPLYGDSTLVATNYQMDDQKLSVTPSSLSEMERCKPLYVTLPLWKENIQAIRRFEDLPLNAQKFIRFVGEQVGCEVTMVGVGPDNQQIIRRGQAA